MSTKTTTAVKATATRKATAAKPKARKASKPAVQDLRRWHKPEGRKDGIVPTKTTMTVGYDTRDALYDYQQSLGLSNYDEVIRYMLIEAGYEIDPTGPASNGAVSA